MGPACNKGNCALGRGGPWCHSKAFFVPLEGPPRFPARCLVLLRGAEVSGSRSATLQFIQSTSRRDVSPGFQRFPACPLSERQVLATTLFSEPSGCLCSDKTPQRMREISVVLGCMNRIGDSSAHVVQVKHFGPSVCRPHSKSTFYRLVSLPRKPSCHQPAAGEEPGSAAKAEILPLLGERGWVPDAGCAQR